MTEREEFEAWFKKRHVCADFHGSRELGAAMGNAWEGWQAARRTVSGAQAECGKSSGEAALYDPVLGGVANSANAARAAAIPQIFYNGDTKRDSEFRKHANSFAAPQHSADIDAMRQWRPIETAPKDREIWAYNGEQARMIWSEGSDWALWIWADQLLNADPAPDQPMHWMPLPAAPAASSVASTMR